MHFPCGQDNGATFQFQGKMSVYCGQHRVRQKVNLLLLVLPLLLLLLLLILLPQVDLLPTPPDKECVICYEPVQDSSLPWLHLRAPCCGRHLHRY